MRENPKVVSFGTLKFPDSLGVKVTCFQLPTDSRIIVLGATHRTNNSM